MTGVLASISGQFSKSLIMGTFFPVLLFVIFGYLLWLPLLPDDWALFSQFDSLDAQWRVLALLFVTLLLTGVLYNLNVPLVRLYEGYPWKDSWFGALKTRHYLARFETAASRVAGYRTLIYALRSGTNDASTVSMVNKRWQEAFSARNALPARRDIVLPTRLGNVIRNFESYPSVQYEMDAVVLWPRLMSKIDKDFAIAIDDAKSSFEFLLNSSALSSLLALCILVTGLIFPTPLAIVDFFVPWVAEVVLFGLAAYVLYLVAIGRAHAWGEVVKAAFDLYRWDLLKQLGFTRTPTTLGDERELWHNITQQLLFGVSTRVQPAAYTLQSTSTRSEPVYVQVETTRGVSLPDASGAIAVTISITNIDVAHAATALTVTDKLPDGFEYEWDSARLLGGMRVTVVGANPYKFHLGQLERGASTLLTYRAVPQPVRQDIVIDTTARD
jgi:hypothetical protein